MTGPEWGSAKVHRRTIEPKPAKYRRRCPCGCKQRATHIGMANGVAMMEGCELRVRRWVRDARA